MSEHKSYRAIFTELPSPSAILELHKSDYKISDVNSAYLEATNTSRDQVVGAFFLREHLEQILEEPHEISSVLRESLDKLDDSENPIEHEVMRCQLATVAEEPQRCWQFVLTPVSNGQGDLSCIIYTLRDVTDLLTNIEKQGGPLPQIDSRSQLHTQNKVLENQITRKINQYKAASKELNDFIYSVSHDLRAPLRRIDGFSQELINEHLDQLDEMAAHYLRRIRQGAQDMGNLIDDLLKLSRISRREVEVTSIDLSKIAQSVYNTLLEMEDDRNVTFSVKSELTTEADEGLVKVMLSNLISNALKFTAKEEQAVIKMGRTQKNGSAYFYIRDNGAGFDPDYSDKLFKAFDRLHSQKEFQGSGIGLATVKRIVNLHGGTIWAEGIPDEGAAFYFKFQDTR